MGRAPCCDKANVKRGPWAPEEDTKLKEFIEKNGTGGNWIALPHKAGLKRCGKSCRLRWLNYLRPNLKHGEFSDDEDRIICSLFASIGSRWSIIATHLPGRTDNDIKNYWNTKLKKKLLGIAPSQRKTHPGHHQNLHQQHQQLFTSSLQSTAIAPPPCYTSSSKPILTGLESFQIPHPDVLNTVTIAAATTTSGAASLLQGPMHHQYQMRDGNGGGSTTLLVFGGDQQSCSSSDGSQTQMIRSYGKEIIEQVYNGNQVGFESLLYNSSSSTGIDQNQKLLLPGIGGYHHDRVERGGNHMGLWGEPSLEYGYEEIKQMITAAAPFSSSSHGCNNNNIFLDDPTAIRDCSHKSQERPMYHYSL